MKNPPRCCLCKDIGSIPQLGSDGKKIGLMPCPACQRAGSMKRPVVRDGKVAAAGDS
jgi:hypothetical protein